jgi:glycerol-3-phosphate acyltransferase PlsY
MIPALQLLAAYLLGAIPFAYIAGKALKGIDIRQHGSGNVGATNVLRVLGKGPGAAVLAMDMAKGCLAAAWLPTLAPAPFVGWAAVLGLAAVLGHSYTCFLSFKGGKGVATSAGVFFGLAPLAMLGVVAVFILVFAVGRMVSAASLAAALCLPALVLYFYGAADPIFWLALILAVIVWVRHIPNLKRIVAGTEPRFGKQNTEA